MKIFWSKPTESGLGDRLKDILVMSAYCKCVNCELYMHWPKAPKHEDIRTRNLDVNHRNIDILINNVKNHIIFPNNINIFDTDLSIGKYDKYFNNYLGGAVDLNGFWNSYLKDVCSFDVFNKNMDITTLEFGFNNNINNYLKTLPTNFISFHIRRGDKVRHPGTTDGTNIDFSEFDNLQLLTYKCIDYYIERFDNFFVCGDEDNKLLEFEEYIASKKKNLLKFNLDIPKWEKTYYDLAIMTKSKINIVSNRYSSFSMFSSLIGHSDFKNVYNYENR